jgi:hypothetical protein
MFKFLLGLPYGTSEWEQCPQIEDALPAPPYGSVSAHADAYLRAAGGDALNPNELLGTISSTDGVNISCVRKYCRTGLLSAISNLNYT